MANWIAGSTVRIAQMTGNYDPDGLTHFKDTADWGIEGTDLGANANHHGITFVYFGDVPRRGPPGDNLDAIGFIEDLKIPERAQLAAARQHGTQSSAFFIDGTGALCVVWVVGGGTWNHPSKISGPNLAPPGGSIAVTRQFSNQLNVFFIGNDGGLYVAWVKDGETWQGPQRISDPGKGSPGGRLAAIKQLENQLNVFFIGTDRKLNVAWVVGGGVWQGPIAIGSPHVPYPMPGGGIATCSQGTQQLDVFFIGQDGGFYVAWSVNGGPWQGPQRVGAAGARVANPGAAIAAFKQTDIQVTALCVNHEGRLTAMWVLNNEVWQGPAPVVPDRHPIQPGAPVTVFPQGPHQWDAFVTASDGAVHVYFSANGEPWKGPHPIAPPGSSLDGTGTAVIQQLDQQITVLFAGKGGDLNVAWVAEGQPWAGPVRINPDMVGLKLVARGRTFFPFTVRGTEEDSTKLWTLGISETPTGAFSFENKVYVFAVAGRERSVCYLTSSAHPERAEPYKLEFVFSRGPDVRGGRFLQVAPVVVDSAEIPGVSHETDRGLILFGHGKACPGASPRGDCINPSPGLHGIQLAYLPLHRNRGPLQDTAVFYEGGSVGPNWSVSEADAKTLFSTCYYWTSLSAGRIGDGKWIVVYQLSGPLEIPASHHRPIVARIADHPWEIATVPEIEIFNPDREGAWNRYMFGPEVPNNNRNRPHVPHPAFAYGAYLLNKYTQWDPARNIATIFFLMSTGRPYQVQLMRASIQL